MTIAPNTPEEVHASLNSSPNATELNSPPKPTPLEPMPQIAATRPVAFSLGYRKRISDYLNELNTSLKRIPGNGVESWYSARMQERFLDIINSEIAVLNDIYGVYGNIDLDTALKNMEELEAARELALDAYEKLPAPDIYLEDLTRPEDEPVQDDNAEYNPELEESNEEDEEDDNTTVTGSPTKKRRPSKRTSKTSKRAKKSVAVV